MSKGWTDMSAYMLVTDMDGTLLNASKQISAQNSAAIERFVRAGGKFTVATGRIESSVIHYIGHLPINVPAILYNGAGIYDFSEKRMLWELGLPDEAQIMVQRMLHEFPGVGVEIYHGGTVYIIAENEYTRHHAAAEQFPTRFVSMDDVPRPWHKVIFTWESEQLMLLEERFRNTHITYDWVRSEARYLELIPAGASKGSALTVLLDMVNNTRQVIALGDYLNDLELLQKADIGIAVGNAHERVKQIAARCCADCDNDALAEVISWLEKEAREAMA